MAVLTEFLTNGGLRDLPRRARADTIVAGFGPTETSQCLFGVMYTMAVLHGKGKMHPHLTDNCVLLNDRFEPLLANSGGVKVWGAQWCRKNAMVTMRAPYEEFLPLEHSLDVPPSLSANVSGVSRASGARIRLVA
jgi:hypothetical protein